ncbi:Uncharacterized protein APZ42_001816 [Daphnia magna]|uniref:Uncharacterized protein n=1 Tax=Daphnia magna TaxID=35525 RepID=A0A164IQB9_9CRUS|nr:Uncharacterized protein APZ42_001816 [Daphnia magna]
MVLRLFGLAESWKPGWFTTCGKSSVVVSNFGNSSQSLQCVMNAPIRKRV